jgi:hypothetical protein
LLAFVILFGCSNPAKEKQELEGTVFEVMPGKVLVLNPVRQDDLGKTWNEIMTEYKGHAIWLKTSEKLQVGQTIQYWVKDEILNTYPSQATASKIIVTK